MKKKLQYFLPVTSGHTNKTGLNIAIFIPASNGRTGMNIVILLLPVTNRQVIHCNMYY